MPAAANIGRLIFFFGHGGDFFVAIDFWEKAIDVNLAPAFGKFNMLIGAYVLVTKKYQPILNKSGLNGFEISVADALANINICLLYTSPSPRDS